MTKRLSILSAIVLMSTFVLLCAMFSIFASPSANAQTMTSPSDLEAGDLIRGQSYSAVYYYGEDGFRYVFPNDKTYFTWYNDFNDVKWLSDSSLATIQIGGNVTYRPGIKMVKINSDPKVYAVAGGGTLRHVSSEAVAISIFGSNWNKMIDDVPDGFFSNYEKGSAIEIASSYDAVAETADATSINVDKDLNPYVTITITDSGYSNENLTVDAGTAVRFVNSGTGKHTASADNKIWGTGTLTTGKHFTRYFSEAGEYEYHCAYDSNMTGTIIVE